MAAGIGVTSHVQWRNSLGRYAADIDQAGERAVEQASRRGAAMAKVFAPKDKLLLAASIEPFIQGKGQGGFRALARYALPQEHGARPHVIASREGPQGILANKDTGFFSAHAVMHPGNPATHFMQRALDIVGPQLMGLIRKNL